MALRTSCTQWHVYTDYLMTHDSAEFQADICNSIAHPKPIILILYRWYIWKHIETYAIFILFI